MPRNTLINRPLPIIAFALLGVLIVSLLGLKLVPSGPESAGAGNHDLPGRLTGSMRSRETHSKLPLRGLYDRPLRPMEARRKDGVPVDPDRALAETRAKLATGQEDHEELRRRGLETARRRLDAGGEFAKDTTIARSEGGETSGSEVRDGREFVDLMIDDKLVRIAKKIPLAPIVPPKREAFPASQRVQRIAELQQKIAVENTGPAKDQMMLALAGNQVGENHWNEARELYLQLASESQDPEVRQAVQRNMQVVDKQLAMMAEPSAARREEQRLELAEIHRDLGHDEASARLCRDLIASSQNPSLRQRAAGMLGEVKNLPAEEIARLLADPSGVTPGSMPARTGH